MFAVMYSYAHRRSPLLYNVFRSLYFRSLFSGHWKEGQQEVVRVQAISAFSFMQVLKFIYTDHLGIPSLDTCLELLYFGKFYGLPTMEWICERYCTSSVSEDN